MALSGDQRAMLQLLLERGQSYDDLASVLGVDHAEVRRRARAALTELGGSDPDESVAITDYLLGEADPIARADAVRHLQGDPDALADAEELAAKLRLIAPDAELPELPQGKKASRAPRATAASDAPSSGPIAGLRGLSTRQSRIYVGIGASAVLLVVVVLAIAGVFSGSDSDSSGGTDTTGQQAEGAIPFALKPQDGSDARGQAALGFASTESTTGGTATDQPYLDLRLDNLPDAPDGQAYVVWFMLNDKSGFPLPAALPVKNGKFSQQLAIPATVYSIIAQMRFLTISLADSKALAGDIKAAIKSGQGVLDNNGQTVLTGEIPASVAESAPTASTTTPTSPTTPAAPTTPTTTAPSAG